MSWNNVIPAELLLGCIDLTPKAVENPQVSIPDELVTDCLIKYSIGDYGLTTNADHPAFAALRKVLASRSYIEIPEYSCWNGDRVLKRFRFNGIQLEPGDTFYCAGAWSSRLNRKKESADEVDNN
jgi:hypothetical protein